MTPRARVVLSAHNVAGFAEGGGHFWAYLQHALGLRAAGCEVWWLEALPARADAAAAASAARSLRRRLRPHGLDERTLLYRRGEDGDVAFADPAAERTIASADLLLNFHYAMSEDLLRRFRRTALVDIDPGLLQLWIDRGELSVAEHDVHLTTGETVGAPGARFPDAGRRWVRIRPPVALDAWPWARTAARRPYTTISSWWGGEWISDGAGNWVDNNKRASFLRFLELPRVAGRSLELALNLGTRECDQDDARLLEAHGWTVRHSRSAASTPSAYRAYVRSSLGEFSCAKPSCMMLQNGWVSDRTLCYLASGRPAIVEHTGPSEVLDGGEGIARFSTLEEAAAAIEDVDARYDEHRRAARELAETHFDARKVAERVLEATLG